MSETMSADEYNAMMRGRRGGRPPAGVDPMKRGDSFEDAVIARAELHGWEVMQIPNWLARLAFGPRQCPRCGARYKGQARAGGKRTRTKGWPDLVLSRTNLDGSETIRFREMKAGTGALRPEQRRWGKRLTAAGLDWAVWTDDDDGWATIERELA